MERRMHGKKNAAETEWCVGNGMGYCIALVVKYKRY